MYIMTSKLHIAVVFMIFSMRCVYCKPEPGKDQGNGDGCGVTNAEIPATSYPNPRRDEKIQNTYPGNTVVKDPYQWMENPESKETKAFITAEMNVTTPYLEKSPCRAEITARCTELYSYQKYSGPLNKGKKFFSTQNNGSQNQDVLYVNDSMNGEGKVFFDPNTLSKDGTVALDDKSFSPDGLVMAYTLSESGSDWMTIQFKHVEKGDIYKEKLSKVKFTDMSWTQDNKGIFYSAYLDYKGKPNGSENDSCQNQKVYYHVLGTDQSKDVMVVEFPDNPDYTISAIVSDDGKYLIVHVDGGINTKLIYVADLEKIKYKISCKLELITIISKMEVNYVYITNYDKKFTFLTNKDADNYKLLTIDISCPDPKSWKDLVPENKDMLDWVYTAYDKYMLLGYIKDVKSVVQLYDRTNGKLIKTFPLDIGTVDADEGVFADNYSPHVFINLESFLSPGIVYHIDLSKPPFDLQILREIKLKNFDREKFVTEQIFFASKDGTKVPMYLVHKKDFEKSGDHSTLLSGYGGYAISKTPKFNVYGLMFASDFNGLFAFASIRGGGEFGESWHRAGSLHNKQNSFDDFQAAAQYLITQKYTNSKLLTINGRSNGGLLMGACLNQRPDLFGVVIADVGHFDMLRFDKFTIGHAWVTEYGSPSNPKDFVYLYKYSPLHNIKIPCDPKQQIPIIGQLIEYVIWPGIVANYFYPATMLTTSDHDDRVSPAHSLKFIATLQYEAKQHPNQKNPFIIRVETDAGHGYKNVPKNKEIATVVDKLCFTVINTGVKFQH